MSRFFLYHAEIRDAAQLRMNLPDDPNSKTFKISNLVEGVILENSYSQAFIRIGKLVTHHHAKKPEYGLEETSSNLWIAIRVIGKLNCQGDRNRVAIEFDSRVGSRPQLENYARDGLSRILGGAKTIELRPVPKLSLENVDLFSDLPPVQKIEVYVHPDELPLEEREKMLGPLGAINKGLKITVSDKKNFNIESPVAEFLRKIGTEKTSSYIKMSGTDLEVDTSERQLSIEISLRSRGAHNELEELAQKTILNEALWTSR